MPLLPPLRPAQNSSETTFGKSKPSNQDFSHERDFLSTLRSLSTLDPNDPRLRSILALQKRSKKCQQAHDVFQAYDIPPGLLLRNAQLCQLPRRHRLLQLRSRNPEDFKGPIPLTEVEIKQDPVYCGLLRPELDRMVDEEEEALDQLSQVSVVILERKKRQRKLVRFIKQLKRNSGRYVCFI